MKLEFAILIIFTLSVFGCEKDDRISQPGIIDTKKAGNATIELHPRQPQLPPGVAIHDDFVTEIPGLDLHYAISPPNAEDKAYAKTLDRKIERLGLIAVRLISPPDKCWPAGDVLE